VARPLIAAAAIAAVVLAPLARAGPPSAAIWDRAGVLVGDTRNFPGPDRLADQLSASGFAWVALQVHKGLAARPVDPAWLQAFRARGLAVGGWGIERLHPEREARLAARLVDRNGLDFYIANAEAPYKTDAGGRWGRSAAFTRAFRSREPALPAALVTYGAASCACVLPIDFAAWRRARFAFLPEAYYNEFPGYRPDRTLAHALRAGWSRSQVHPVIGVYHRFPAARYVPLLRRLGTRGFSVFVADAARPSDYLALAPLISAEARGLPVYSSGDAAGPASVAPPVLAGRPLVGTKLVVAPGAWLTQTPLTVRYSWERCRARTCAPIDNAEGATYVLGPDDAGSRVRAVVGAGSITGSATARSAAIAVRYAGGWQLLPPFADQP
jgi:hypothetical protein